jgi:hypothetical protein
MPLEEVKMQLESLIAGQRSTPERPWWEVMRDTPDEDTS